jgi:hypothetical protein
LRALQVVIDCSGVESDEVIEAAAVERNPVLSTRNSCGPIGRANNLKLPDSPVVTVRVAPVSRLFTVTVAPLRAAPVASTTFPEIDAATCAPAGARIAMRVRTIKKELRKGLG